MIKFVCSVYDVKATLFSNPYYSVNVAVAIRDFNQGCLDPSSALSRNPEDFSLYQVATFDDESGQFTPTNPPIFLSAAASAITQGE